MVVAYSVPIRFVCVCMWIDSLKSRKPGLSGCHCLFLWVNFHDSFSHSIELLALVFWMHENGVFVTLWEILSVRRTLTDKGFDLDD